MYIIIGQGAAGVNAAFRLRQLDPDTPVTVITQEPDFYYSRIDLPDIIAGKFEAGRSLLKGPEDFREYGINCRMNCLVTSIEPAKQSIVLSTGETLSYRKLLLATGSSPLLPPMEGINAQGVYSLWNMRQAAEIIAAAASAKTAAVIGAGLIGLKTALALAERGLKVTVVERLPRVMPRQLDEEASAIIAAALRAKGITILTGVGVERFETDGRTLRGVRTRDGVIFADMAVVSVGVRANIDLAVKAGVNTDKGIQVDEHMQTSAVDIYAAGDAAEVVDALSGRRVVPAIWPEAVRQGRIAASNMAGRREEYVPGTAMNSVDIAGIPLVSVGRIEEEPADQIYVHRQGNVYIKTIISDGILIGALCIGNIKQAGVLGNLVLRQAKIEQPEALIRKNFSFAQFVAV